MATARRSYGVHPLFMATNALIWISAVIVMGIISYWLSQNHNQGSHVIYEEVIAVLTVAFFLVAFFLGAYPGTVLLFYIIFSYLWLVAVAFAASDWSNSGAGALAHTVEAFCFIAFFLLFFNVVYDWHIGHRATRTTSTV
jgi:TRAP-type mannitol/chloroaromatic compound transport system permease small subunit